MSDLRLSSGQIVLKAISVTGMPNIQGRHCNFQYAKADAYKTVFLFEAFSDKKRLKTRSLEYSLETLNIPVTL